MLFELFADTGAKERGPELGPSLTSVPCFLRSGLGALGSQLAPFQKCEAAPRRARIQGSQTFVKPNSRLETDKEKKKVSP